MSRNLGEPEDVREEALRAKRRQEQSDLVLRTLLGHKDGRNWLFGLLERCGVFQTSFDKSALQMSFLEGQRNVGLWLVSELVRIGPDEYVLMLREQRGDKDE